MSITTIVVMIVAAIVGYFLVSGLFPDSSAAKNQPPLKDSPLLGDIPDQPLAAPVLDQRYIQQHWYEILQVASTASRHEITQGYEQQLACYHPQHFSGFSPDMQLLAAQHIQQIKAAYQHALSLKGFNDF